MKHTLPANALVLLLVAAGAAFATPASRQEAQLAARKLLRPDESMVPTDVWTVSSLVASGDTVGYIVKAGDAGWAIVPSLKELGPIAAYSRTSGLPSSAEDPMLLTIGGRLRRAAVAFTTNVGASGGGGNSIYREQYAANLARWDLPGSAEKVDAVTKGPLLNSYWGQNWPYNEKCPAILGTDHAPAGCVAIAVGQILNYWRHPISGVGGERYWWPSGQRYLVAYFDDPYDWSHIYPSYIPDDPQEAIDAVSELIYEVGVSVNADFGAYVTSAATERVPISLHTFFRFQDTMQIRNRTDFATVEDWFALIAGEIDAGRPMYYRFDLPDGGHAVVCDGYRIDEYGQAEIHLNYGWFGGNTDYYLIESEVSSWPESERVCVGIAPQGWGEWNVPELESCEATTMSWGDYNGDDLPDLFVGDSFFTPGRLFENGGGAGLVWRPLPECAVSNPYASAWADYNNDQCDDLLIAGVGGATILESVVNDITGRYELQEVVGVFAPSPGTSRTCGWGDFDRDGWVDVVLGTEAGGAMVYLGGQGQGGEFGRVATLGAGEWVVSVGVADINADGLLELIS